VIARALFANALLFAVLFPAGASARTWRVEREGPADFTTIQPALDAAAPGDTILVGPGRYLECQSVTLPGWSSPVEVYGYVQRNDLTIIGAGDTSTIIGPLVAQFEQYGPKGLVALDLPRFTVQGLVLSNLYDGVFLRNGSMRVYDCRFDGCADGIHAFEGRNVSIESCDFWNATANGVAAYVSCSDVEVAASAFRSCPNGVNLNNSATRGVVRDCSFTDCRVGIQISQYSTDNLIQGCVFSGEQNVGVTIAIVSSAHLEGNVFVDGATNLQADTRCTVTATSNLLNGGGYATIVSSTSDLTLHGNDILNGGGDTVKLACYVYPPVVVLDLTDNFWGTADANQIAQWIWDGHDDPAIHAIVDFEPFMGGPVPAESRSWGAVKDLFRGAK
jgi:hypothetical protein